MLADFERELASRMEAMQASQTDQRPLDPEEVQLAEDLLERINLELVQTHDQTMLI